MVDDLKNQSYRPELFTISVVADRCSDRTAARRGQPVPRYWSRSEGPDGKGAALRWLLDVRPLVAMRLWSLSTPTIGCRQICSSGLSDEIDGAARCLQAYLDVSNPEASPLATASALSYWASNRMVQLARHNLAMDGRPGRNRHVHH